MTKKEAMRQTHQENALMSLGFTRDEAEQLRRISNTLHRWFEHECNGAIQRDEDGDGKPYWYNTNTGRKIGPAPDREKGAMQRLQHILDTRNTRDMLENKDDAQHLRYYIQSDPRGAVLYIIRPGDVPEGADVNGYYSRGICVY